MWKFYVIKTWDSVWSEEHLSEWSNLLSKSPTSHVFFHPMVAQIWVDTYMPLRKLTPIFVWGESQDGNKAFLPLVLWKRDWKGAFLRSIIPVGYSDYDYHDPLFLIAPREEVLTSFWNELLRTLEAYNADEILLSGFRDRCVLSDGIWTQGEICPSLDLTNITSEEELLSFLGSNLRGDIRRRMRRLGEMGELHFVEYASFKDIPDGLFEQFMEAHRQKWPHAYKAPHFHEHLVASCGIDSPIHFSVMMLNNQPISWHLGFDFQQGYYYYMPAVNLEYQKLSPGKIHIYHLMLRAIEKGYTLYDHLRGDETYKSGWSDGCQYVNDRIVHSGSVPSRIKHGLIKLKTSFRRS